ncbi:formate dehydrogenase family accessory protein FdhD [Acidovorax sp. Leaf84]|uniref:formate dehydrogenase accessory sulfurtransferase FdhD n=1 Tax=Acidovorax sp. Leaf84 TaxID=1736240 RepID=UPI0007016022|nr:formate dehydrogenase accessory sulfurtransferase FdhD [Acidovorax sp. Leaf84]KQO32539.1 formate dehydrogenase family accessory protein FdhD [Acidovorax sp. Leaf84]
MTSRTATDSTAQPLPRLTQATAPLTHSVDVVNELGEREQVSIPAERPLTVYVDRRELVTLMTLGAQPELLVLGYLRNQRLVESVLDIESITVDWDVHAAAVRTRHGIERIEERTASKVVTTGCGQGSVFGGLMDEVDRIVLPEARLTQAQLYGIVNAIRLKETTYKSAGSVHGCALFRGEELLTFVEDVGRHNAIDTIAGWMWMNAQPPRPTDAATGGGGPAPEPMSGADKVFYTTGRLTSEMVIKSAQMGVPIVVSRSGMTQMGHAVAQQLGLCAIGRATNRRFVCYSGADRLVLQPELAQAPAVLPAAGAAPQALR